MQIDVTDGDIRDGDFGSCSRCPIALAIARTVRMHVKVSEYTVEFYSEGCRLFYAAMPVAAQSFIRRFDYRLPVKGFSFELPLPAKEGLC